MTKIYVKKLRNSQNQKRLRGSKRYTCLRLIKHGCNKHHLKLFSSYFHKTKSPIFFKSLYNIFRKKSILLSQFLNSDRFIINFKPTFTKYIFTNTVPHNLKVFLTRSKYTTTTKSKKSKQSVLNSKTIFKIRLPLRKTFFKTKKRNQLNYLNFWLKHSRRKNTSFTRTLALYQHHTLVTNTFTQKVLFKKTNINTSNVYAITF